MFTSSVRTSDFIARVHRWQWVPIAWSLYGNSSSTTLHRSGVSYDGTNVYQHLLTGETESAVDKSIAETTWTAPSVSTTSSWTGGTVRIHGVESTYDPQSAMRILTWRAVSGVINLQAVHPMTGFLAPVVVEEAESGEDQAAYGTPSVACADTGAHNCIVVWAEAAERGSSTASGHFHYLRWVHFEVDPTNTYDFADIQSSTLIVHEPPRVTYRGPATHPGAFVVAYPLEYGGLIDVWTLRKSTSTTATWTDAISHLTTSERKAFPLGSAHWHAELPMRRW